MNPYRTAQKAFLRELNRYGVDVTLRWRTVAGGTVHATTGAVLGTPVEATETVKGFFDPIDPKTVIRLFNETSRAMAVLDLDPDTVIENRDGLVFQIDGRLWVQADVGEHVIQHFGAFHDGVRYCRTIVLRSQT